MRNLIIQLRLYLITVLFEWILTLAPKHHPEGMLAVKACWRWSAESLNYLGVKKQ